MDRFIDLHLHSTFSDGSLTPRQVVVRAAGFGFSAIALADHDSVSGVAEAQAAGVELGIEVIPSTELSAQMGTKDIHILGYFVNVENGDLLESLTRFQQARLERAEKMVAKLNQMGIRLDMARVLAKAGKAAVGRPHVADALVEEGFVFSAEEAFQKYLGYARPAYHPKYTLTPGEAIEVIHASGGLASLAHPGLYSQDSLIKDLVAQGLNGLEVMHIKHDAIAVAHYTEMADHFKLLKTGGSDCHGDGRGESVMGRVKTPAIFLEAMKIALKH